VGAYGAAVACEAIAFDDALRLVKLRAELMESAYPRGFGMLAVSGLNERQLSAVIENAGTRDAYIANLNAPRQIVVAGSDIDLHRIHEASLEAGARKADRLAVSVPSHCVLLDVAARTLTAAASKIEFHVPCVPYISNRGARPLRLGDAIRNDLATNLRYPVRWHDSTIVLNELGVSVFVEMPPGNTLTQLAGDALPDVAGVAIEQMSSASVVALVRARAGL